MPDTVTTATEGPPKLDFEQICRIVREFRSKHSPGQFVKHLFLSEETLDTLKRHVEESPCGPVVPVAAIDSLCGITVYSEKDPFERKIQAFTQAWRFGSTSAYEDEDGNLIKVMGKEAEQLSFPGWDL